MALGVCALFDASAERVLRRLWSRLESAGVPTLASHTHGRHHPHLSYVVLLEWDLAAVRGAVQGLADHRRFPITFDAVGAFRRGRVALVPAVPPDLLGRQRTLVERVRATGALVHRHYEPGRWLPHCSLAPRARLSQLHTVAEAVYDILPLTVWITRAALIDSVTGQSWPLSVLP